MTARAYSIDGRTFVFEAELTFAVPVGTYMRIADGSARSYLGQVLTVEIDQTGRTVSGRGSIVCEVDGDAFPASAGTPISADAELRPVDPQLLATYIGSTVAPGAGLEIGTVQSVPTVSAVLRANGFGRHTFLCGQSGSGKTYTLGVVLEQLLLETDIRIVVLDPNSDFVNMGSVRLLGDSGLSPEIHAARADRYSAVASRIHVFGGEGSSGRLRSRYGQLSFEQQTMVLGLDPLADAEEYNAFVRIIRSLRSTDYSLMDVMQAIRASFDDGARRLGLRIENLGILDQSIWAGQDEPVMDALPGDWRMLVADLGSLPSPAEASIAAAALLGFLWDQRYMRRPLIIVIDEAHNVCPQKPADVNQALATEHVVRIAGEGRKYGRYLLLSTQRPNKVHENVISQCDNLLLMRMNSHSDIRRLCDLFSQAPSTLIDRATTFGLGEGLAAGKIAPNPLLFVSGHRLTVEGGSDVPEDWAIAR